MKSASEKRTPSIVNLTVKRRYLTEREVERLMDCARKHGRYGHRDATMILQPQIGVRRLCCFPPASRKGKACKLGPIRAEKQATPPEDRTGARRNATPPSTMW